MVGIVLAIILLIGGLFISSNNKAIFLEEQINASTWLRFLYQYNLINIVLGGIIRGIL